MSIIKKLYLNLANIIIKKTILIRLFYSIYTLTEPFKN